MAQLFPPSTRKAHTLMALSNGSEMQTTNNVKCMPGSGKGVCPQPHTRRLIFQMLWENRCWWQSLRIKALIGNRKANLKELRWGSRLMQLSFFHSDPPPPLPPRQSLLFEHPSSGFIWAVGIHLGIPFPQVSFPITYGAPWPCWGVIFLGTSNVLTGLNTELGQFILKRPNHAASFCFPFYFLTCFQLPFWCLITA